MRYCLITLMLVLLVVFPCCRRHSSEWDTLLSIEKDIIDYPDSALTVLEAMDTSRLYGEEEKALYGLLLTMALSKNHIDIPDDSLIHFASRYFENKKDKRRSMIADCYLGTVQFNLGYRSESIVNYYKSKQAAEELGDWFYAGLACRGISDVYNESLNKKEELLYADKELEYFHKSGKQPYVNYAILDFARATYNNSDFDRASKIIEQLVDSTIATHDDYLYYSALHLKSANYVTQNKFAEALPILKEIIESGYAEAVDSLRLCWTLIKLNKHGEARIFGNEILNNTSPWNNFVKYRIYKYQGKYDKALTELEILDSLSENNIYESISNNINGGLVNYVESKNLIAQSRLEESRMRFWLIGTVLSVLLIVITTYARVKYKQWNKELDAKINFAEELQEALKTSKERNNDLVTNLESEKEAYRGLTRLLDEKKREQEQLLGRIEAEKSSYHDRLSKLQQNANDKSVLINDLKSEISYNKTEIELLTQRSEEQGHQIATLENETVQLQRKIRLLEEVDSKTDRSTKLMWKLMSKRKAGLEDFIRLLSVTKNSETARKKIADKITVFIHELSEDTGSLDELEREVNKEYANLIKDLRTDLPNLKEKDFRLYLFSLLPISLTSIALLMGEQSVEGVYNRKRHLKDKIKQLDQDKRDRYLYYLE